MNSGGSREIHAAERRLEKLSVIRNNEQQANGAESRRQQNKN